MINLRRIAIIFVRCFIFLCVCLSLCFSQITAPEEYLGFKPGADFKLFSYEKALGYLELLASQTERVQIFDMGPTGYGRRMKYAVISSEENMANLDRYKEISRRMSLGRGVSREEAIELADEGRAIVWIDGAIHREEVVGSQMIPQLAYDVVMGNDRRIRLIRDNVILILVFANPDGMTIVSDWYMKHVTTKYESSPLPWLYLKLGGTNRDAFISNLLETRNINRAVNKEWFPVIYHNQHQTGPFPARIFIPPEGEPTNTNVHPLVIRAKNLIGAAMGQGLDEADLPGAISRSAYDTWFPAYATQAPEGHNIPGILTETQSNRTSINRLGRATPQYYTVNDFPEEYRDLLMGIFYPSPWKAGWWRLSDQVEYNITASIAELDVAAKYRHEFLFNKWKMAHDIIERFKKEPPYGWIISANQRDSNTAALMIKRLLMQNLEIYAADAAFEYEGISYPEGSYIIPTSQPFGLYIKNLLEIQNHPDLRKYSHLWQALPRLVKYEAEPMRPYDNVGWTLPIHMGVDSRVMSRPLEIDMTLIKETKAPAGTIKGAGSHYIFSHSDNNSFKAANRILKAGGKVSLALDDFILERTRYPKGTFIVDGRSITTSNLKDIASDTQIPMRRGTVRANSQALTQARVALYKSWVRNDDAAWSIWLFDRYDFPFHLLTNTEIQSGNLRERFDVIVLPDQSARSIIDGYKQETTPPEYAGGITLEGVNNLKTFAKQGGTIVCNKSSSDLVLDYFNLPIKNILRGVPAKSFNCPGSIVKMNYDTGHPIAFGMQENGIGFFSGAAMRDAFLGGYVFEILQDKDAPAEKSSEHSPKIVAHFPEESLLISGWLIGEDKIQGKAAILDVPMDKGRIILFGFNVQNRAHSHSTFKLIFNALYYGGDFNE